MEEQFKAFLKEEGYSEITPSGKLSVVYDYAKRVIKISKDEGYSSLEEMAKNIDFLLLEYGEDGKKSYIGKKSNNAVIYALKAFKNFIIGERGIKGKRKK